MRIPGAAGVDVRRPSGPPGLYYDPQFLTRAERSEVTRWLSKLRPIWEKRFSKHHPAPEGVANRPLLRPVYWLGNWQFACLGYYHPPRKTQNRCVAAEPFPPALAVLVRRVEKIVHRQFPPSYIPRGWHLNTCLVNLYGGRIQDGKMVDNARVGEHKDAEPGPVASISIGERALFQFVASRGKGHASQVVMQQWLDDCSLQIFAGPQFKDRLFHRVQRVDKKAGHRFVFPVDGFETRRVNFTFRYVPPKDIVPFSKLPKEHAEDVQEYVEALAENSPFWRGAL
ncbi:alpha-ketoglutarate-dependent dioxygenase AlkB [bacterium]|nr:alpha-ketoglutarate-dependent dioxygenase AlkB [bacterium]